MADTATEWRTTRENAASHFRQLQLRARVCHDEYAELVATRAMDRALDALLRGPEPR